MLPLAGTKGLNATRQLLLFPGDKGSPGEPGPCGEKGFPGSPGNHGPKGECGQSWRRSATSGACKPGLVSHTSLIKNKGIKLGEQSKLVGVFHDPGES